jgi:hypothetical protein
MDPRKERFNLQDQETGDEDIPYNAIYGLIKQLEEDIGGFKRLLAFNEASRRCWREYHMEAWRVTVTPLKVVDLPQEILSMIFANFEDVPTPPIQDPVGSTSFEEDLPKPDVASIKSIRLTCRAFCEAGSRFLLPVVDVSFTRACVQRLEEISNHPSISRGVQIIRIHTDAYNHSLANSLNQFCCQISQKLGVLPFTFATQATSVQRQVTKDCLLAGLIPKPKFLKIRGLQMALKDAQELEAIVDKLIHRVDQAALHLDPFETKINKAIVKAHEEYKQRYLEQESLAKDARICANISTAMSLMPSVQRLCITECGPRKPEILGDSLYEPVDVQKWRSALKSSNIFRNMMLHTGTCPPTLLEWKGEPPFSLVLQLPLLLSAGSRNLTHLDIDIPPIGETSLGIESRHLESLRRACQQLKSIKVRMKRFRNFLDILGNPATVYALLEPMLASPGLEVVKLDLSTQCELFLVSDPESIGSLLTGLSWNKLRTIHLSHVAIEADKLREVLGKAPGRIHLDLNGIFLMEGTWAEALEILRAKADSSSRVVNPRGVGVELNSLSTKEAGYLRQEFDSEHRNGWYSAQRCPGPASFYIRGGNIPNPLIRVDD